MSRRRHRHGIRWRSLYEWHRLLGLSAAAFVLLLASTGLLLNHSSSWGLDRDHITLHWLLDWYGIQAPGQGQGLQLGSQRLSQLGKRLYLDEQEIPGSYGRLIGAVVIEHALVVALEGELLLLAADGRLIEKLGQAQGVPAGMRALGLTADGRVATRAAHAVYIADRELLQWHDHSTATIHWSRPDALSARRVQDLAKHYRARELTRERVLLDIHSGRIMGQGGVILMDAMAILFLLLATTGVWLWAKRKR